LSNSPRRLGQFRLPYFRSGLASAGLDIQNSRQLLTYSSLLGVKMAIGVAAR